MKTKKCKQIVFVNQSSGYLMVDIINEQAEEYDNVILITGNLNIRNKPLDPKVKVHFFQKYNRKSITKRVWSWLLFTIQTWVIITFKYSKAHVFLVSNPPLVVFIALLLRNHYTFLIYDVYPDALESYKYLSTDSWMYKYWVKVNKMVYSRSQKIYTIGEGMKGKIGNYVSLEEISVVPLWTDNTYLKPLTKLENNFVKKHNLSGKFVLLYSGNIGKTHPVEIIIEIAEELKGDSVQIVIIGEGEKKGMLMELSKKKGLNNVLFLPFQNSEDFPLALAAGDLSLVTLGEEASLLSVPSKTFNIMSVGTPILGVASKQSELAKIIESTGSGKCFEIDNWNEMIEFIRSLLKNPSLHRNMGGKSLAASWLFGSSNASLFKNEG